MTRDVYPCDTDARVPRTSVLYYTGYGDGIARFEAPDRSWRQTATMTMGLAPHEKDVAGEALQALKRGEDVFFDLLTRAPRQGEVKQGQDHRAILRALSTMVQTKILMLKEAASAEPISQAEEDA